MMYLVNIFVDAVGELSICKSKTVGSNINVQLEYKKPLDWGFS